jgi:hypothetical protein
MQSTPSNWRRYCKAYLSLDTSHPMATARDEPASFRANVKDVVTRFARQRGPSARGGRSSPVTTVGPCEGNE